MGGACSRPLQFNPYLINYLVCMGGVQVTILSHSWNWVGGGYIWLQQADLEGKPLQVLKQWLQPA